MAGRIKYSKQAEDLRNKVKIKYGYEPSTVILKDKYYYQIEEEGY